MAKALKNERRRARAAAAAAHMQSAATSGFQAPPPAAPVVSLAEWRAINLREKYALAAAVADVGDEERARVNAAAEVSDSEMARLLMRLGKEKILRASARAAEYKKET